MRVLVVGASGLIGLAPGRSRSVGFRRHPPAAGLAHVRYVAFDLAGASSTDRFMALLAGKRTRYLEMPMNTGTPARKLRAVLAMKGRSLASYGEDLSQTTGILRSSSLLIIVKIDHDVPSLLRPGSDCLRPVLQDAHAIAIR